MENFKCKKCDRTYNSASDISDHLSENHAKDSYLCIKRGSEHSYVDPLENHIRTYTTDTTLHCDEGEKQFTIKLKIPSHQSTSHIC